MAPKVNLTNLPSGTNLYHKFVNADGKECNSIGGGYDKLKGALEGKFKESAGPTSLAGIFMGAYCIACEKKKEYELNQEKPHLKDAPCQAFYHWIGKYILNTDGGYKISDVLEKIYGTLDDTTLGQNKCTITYADVDKDKFDNRKKVFDHYHDCSTVQRYLDQIKDRAGGAEKDPQWTFYKAEVTNACDAISTYCATNGVDTTNKDPYCDEYKTKYKTSCDGVNQTPLTCSEIKEPEVEGPLTDPQHELEPPAKLAAVGAEEPHDQEPSEPVRDEEPSKEPHVLKGPESHTTSTLTGDGLKQHVSSQLEVTLPISTTSTESTNSSVTSAAVSAAGGLAAIGIPALGYFLYKVIQ